MKPSPCPSCNGSSTRYLFCKNVKGKDWYLARCDGCRQHFTDPPPTPDEINSFYNSDYHSTLCQPGASEREYGPKFKRYVDWISKFLPTGRTLDVGCTTGLLPKMLQDAGYQAYGIELNTAAANWGSEHYKVPVSSDPIEALQARGEVYDLITLADLLEHTPNPKEFLAAVRRLIKNRGFLMVTFPDIRSLESRYYRLLSLVTRRHWLWMTCQIPLHTWEFTAPTARALFLKQGFEIVGFRRSPYPFAIEGKFWPLSLPVRLMRVLSNLTGTQMEFMLRRND